MSDGTSDNFDVVAGKISQLVRMLASDADGEALSALRALKRTLAGNGLDFHALAERIERGGAMLEAEMKAIWDQAIEWHVANEAAIRATAEPESNGIFTSARTVERPVEPGVNGYSWQEISEHCAKNKHLFSGRSLEFVESIPEKINHFGSPTLKQANWLRDLFLTKCDGRIE